MTHRRDDGPRLGSKPSKVVTPALSLDLATA